MSLAHQLLQQAWRLALADPRRPIQANLRRAVSSAYYAFFHLLVESSTASILGRSRRRSRFRMALARAFDHGAMRRASRWFITGAFPARLADATGAVRISPELRRIAMLFAHLQDQRHLADYGVANDFRRGEVIQLLKEVDRAFATWKRIAGEDETAYFLALLVAARGVTD